MCSLATILGIHLMTERLQLVYIASGASCRRRHMIGPNLTETYPNCGWDGYTQKFIVLAVLHRGKMVLQDTHSFLRKRQFSWHNQ